MVVGCFACAATGVSHKVLEEREEDTYDLTLSIYILSKTERTRKTKQGQSTNVRSYTGLCIYDKEKRRIRNMAAAAEKLFVNCSISKVRDIAMVIV
jgi:hypothetical protein